MARNGSTGAFTKAVADFVAATVISETAVNTLIDDIAAEITNSVAVDGQSTMTSALKMGTQRITGLASGTALTDAATLSQAQNEAFIWCSTMTGSGDAGVLTPSPAITAYVAGQRFAWKASAASNTGAMTVAISGLSAIAVQSGLAALAAGKHAANGIYMGVLDTTSTIQIVAFQLASDIVTTRGDIIRADSSGSPERLALGAAGTAVMSDGTDAVFSGVHQQGKHTVFIPAAAMRPTVSNGCAQITDVETTAGRPDIQVLDFDDGADEHAQFQIAMPKSWNAGTVTAQFYWTSTATDTDGVTWGIQGVAVHTGGTIDVAYGTPQVIDDANESTAEELLVTAETPAVTIATPDTIADTDMCFFRVFRDTSDANDTATEDARLVGVKLLITTNAADDT